MPLQHNPLNYSAKLFPFAGILEQLTQEFKAKDTGPLSAYTRFQFLRRAHGLLSGADYCSTSITSSGHARINTLAANEVIARNTASGRQLVAERHLTR